MTSFSSRRSSLAVAVMTAYAMAALVDTALRAEADSSDSLIQRLVVQTTRTNLSIRATRQMRAGTASGKHQGWMTIETAVTPAGVFSWKVLEQGGSERTRDKVFLALLEGERDSWRTGDRDDASLTPANYEFTPLPSSRPGQMQFRLKPRREDSKLVDGILTVSPDGYPLRLEGKLAKSPSFWMKSVTVTKRYGRFAGVALPTVIESVADLKLFGRSTFTMRYHYSEVNGRNVALQATNTRD